MSEANEWDLERFDRVIRNGNKRWLVGELQRLQRVETKLAKAEAGADRVPVLEAALKEAVRIAHLGASLTIEAIAKETGIRQALITKDDVVRFMRHGYEAIAALTPEAQP